MKLMMHLDRRSATRAITRRESGAMLQMFPGIQMSIAGGDWASTASTNGTVNGTSLVETIQSG